VHFKVCICWNLDPKRCCPVSEALWQLQQAYGSGATAALQWLLCSWLTALQWLWLTALQWSWSVWPSAPEHPAGPRTTLTSAEIANHLHGTFQQPQPLFCNVVKAPGTQGLRNYFPSIIIIKLSNKKFRIYIKGTFKILLVKYTKVIINLKGRELAITC